MITETSRRALETVNKHEWYGRIVALMRKHPKKDWCISEIANALGEQKSSVSPRLGEMRAYGWITKNGERKSRITNINSVVYVLRK
jgi:DNA-binding transcriptional regulator GbsR (MarR family)